MTRVGTAQRLGGPHWDEPVPAIENRLCRRYNHQAVQKPVRLQLFCGLALTDNCSRSETPDCPPVRGYLGGDLHVKSRHWLISLSPLWGECTGRIRHPGSSSSRSDRCDLGNAFGGWSRLPHQTAPIDPIDSGAQQALVFSERPQRGGLSVFA